MVGSTVNKHARQLQQTNEHISKKSMVHTKLLQVCVSILFEGL